MFLNAFFGLFAIKKGRSQLMTFRIRTPSAMYIRNLPSDGPTGTPNRGSQGLPGEAYTPKKMTGRKPLFSSRKWFSAVVAGRFRGREGLAGGLGRVWEGLF